MSYYFMAPGARPSVVCIGSAQRTQGAMLQGDTEIVHGFSAFIETQKELIEHLLDEKVILSNRQCLLLWSYFFQDFVKDISIIAKMGGGRGEQTHFSQFLAPCWLKDKMWLPH